MEGSSHRVRVAVVEIKGMATSPHSATPYRYPRSRTNRAIQSYSTSADLLTVAGAVFDAERRAHSGDRIAELVLPLNNLDKYNLKRLDNAVTDILLFVLSGATRVLSVKAETSRPARNLPEPVLSDYVCLFSGGTDSFVGLITASLDIKNVQGVFCAHSDQSRIVKIVTELAAMAFPELGDRIHKVSVPAVGIRGYAQLRGFLYCVAAAAWMFLVNARVLLVTECGPTMYQPQFSPLDQSR